MYMGCSSWRADPDSYQYIWLMFFSLSSSMDSAGYLSHLSDLFWPNPAFLYNIQQKVEKHCCICLYLPRGGTGVHHLPWSHLNAAWLHLLGHRLLHHVADAGHRQCGERHLPPHTFVLRITNLCRGSIVLTSSYPNESKRQKIVRNIWCCII